MEFISALLFVYGKVLIHKLLISKAFKKPKRFIPNLYMHREGITSTELTAVNLPVYRLTLQHV
ncbi:MAG: hypothetical protein AB1861_10495 [Cyanobacteriota bacterium]